jgi:PqqD family protein of HPr-rel-A system
MTSSPIWRLAPGQRLLHRCWDGECVLYNDLSGDTHLLDEAALALLQHLQAAPQAAAQLVAAFDVEPATAAEAGNASLPELHDDALFDTMLADLAALHLIEPLPC